MLLLIVAASGASAAELPNVLIIVADDLGYSDLGCFGSEIATPHLDALARQGVTFSSFYTAPTCSPTRAMLLTGVDHHQAGMGNMYEFLSSAPAQIGKPGYEGFLNDRVVTIAEVLRPAGYHTSISGKWHLGRRGVNSPAAHGFERSWVLLDGWAEHFFPSQEANFVRYFREDGRLVDYPQGKYSSEWFTDKAIEFTDEARTQQRPFFLVASYTAPHWPLQAPPEFLERQRGKYDGGYDQLRRARIAALVERKIVPAAVAVQPPPRTLPVLHHAPPLLPYRPWEQLARSERQYSARLMEAYAAMVEAMDAEIGRLFDHLKRRGQFENTLICFLSDNGAAPMISRVTSAGNRLDNVGHPGSFVGYGPNWGRASAGPFRLLKGHSAEGGIRAPCIVKLPRHAAQRWSAEFVSAADIAPTIYELAGVAYPNTFDGSATLPLTGRSMLAHLRDDEGTVHGPEYRFGWELFGRAAFRRGRWKITWIEEPFGPGRFELFDILRDPGETKDLRDSQADLFAQLQTEWQDYVRQRGVIISRPPNWSQNSR